VLATHEEPSDKGHHRGGQAMRGKARQAETASAFSVRTRTANNRIAAVATDGADELSTSPWCVCCLPVIQNSGLKFTRLDEVHILWPSARCRNLAVFILV
jgi:hypothetical protein